VKIHRILVNIAKNFSIDIQWIFTESQRLPLIQSCFFEECFFFNQVIKDEIWTINSSSYSNKRLNNSLYSNRIWYAYLFSLNYWFFGRDQSIERIEYCEAIFKSQPKHSPAGKSPPRLIDKDSSVIGYWLLFLSKPSSLKARSRPRDGRWMDAATPQLERRRRINTVNLPFSSSRYIFSLRFRISLKGVVIDK